MMELLEGRFFKTFVTVLEERSFSRAAEKLGYVQSTVTTHIQLLEQACRQKLFHRLSRGVKPTEAGLKLAPYAYQFIQLGLSIEEILNESNQPQGLIQTRMQESFFVTRLAGPILQFLNKYPKIKILPETGFQQDILRNVLDHTVDFGFVPQDPDRKEVRFYPLVEESLVFVASDALADRISSEGTETLNHETVICFGTTCLYNTNANKTLSEHGVQVKRAIELPSMEMIKKSLLCGMGYALLPKISVEEELRQGTLKILSFSNPITIMHGLIVHKNHELNLASTLFLNFITEFFNISPRSV